MEKIEISVLNKKHLKDVVIIDNERGGKISEELGTHEYVYGIFLNVDNNAKLVGYCTIGEVDGSGLEVDNLNDYLLSDLYILKEFRKEGYGSKLITGAVNLKSLFDSKSKGKLYADVVDFSLESFYEKNGFEVCIREFSELVMVKIF